MLFRLIGFVSFIILIIASLASLKMIEVTAPPLKQLIDVLIALGQTIKNGLQSL